MTTDLSACFHIHLSSSAAGSKMILGFWAPLSLCNNLHAAYLINLDGILKSRDITLPTKVYLVQAMVFPVVMYVCESWTIKKAECQRNDFFELWCWIRLLRVSWTARRSNLSILKEISPEYSKEGLMLKLKLQYCGHLMWRIDSLYIYDSILILSVSLSESLSRFLM